MSESNDPITQDDSNDQDTAIIQQPDTNTPTLNNEATPVTVNQEETSVTPASPSNIDEGAIVPSRDKTPTTINSSIPEPHGTNDMAPNDPHADTATHNPVNREALEQTVGLLMAKVTSLEKLISQLITNSNLAIVGSTYTEN